MLNITGGQCRRSKLVCQGYQDSLTFVMYQQTDGQSAVSPSPVPKAEQIKIRPKSKCTSPTAVSTFSLNSATFEDQLFHQYWERYYPSNSRSPFKYEHTQTQLGSWQIAIKTECLDERIVRSALLAMANGSMYRLSDDDRYKYAAMEIYSRALRELNYALQGDYQTISDRVLATCKLLATFEE